MKKYVFLILLLAFSSLSAAQFPFKEGKHYQQVPFEILEKEPIQELRKQYSDKILVIEFFSYGCHWCHELENNVEQWLVKSKPDYVEFIRIPVVFQHSWANFAKAFYTAQALDVFETIHPRLFDAVHSNKIRTSAPEELQTFFSKQGVSETDFSKTFDSFGIEQQFQMASQISRAYRITAIPTFIIQTSSGAVITSTKMAGGEEEVFQVLDALIEQEHKQLTASKDSH